MKVKQIMIRKVISVKPKTKVMEVAALLDKYSIHGVPVIENKLIIGIITESDFFISGGLDLHIPSYIDFLKRAKFAKNLSGKNKKGIDRLLNATATDIMTKNCFTVSAEMEVKDMIKVFKNKKYFTIPVVDSNKNIIGIITQADIIKLIKV